MEDFTKEEVKALKKVAQEHIFVESLNEGATYRNRFETYEDAYNNLSGMGFSHEEIIKQIGERIK